MRQKIKSPARQYIKTIIVALIIALVLRAFVVQAYKIPSSSMEDVLLSGDFILVNKLTYRFRQPQPQDVIVFKYPLNPSKNYIKRVIATEGQTVEIINKQVFVDEKPFIDAASVKHKDHHVLPRLYSQRDNFGPIQVPAGHLLVLGDNRDDSQDSREWGFVDKKAVQGKAIIVYWSMLPDPKAPQMEFPYIISAFQMVGYYATNIFSKTRWDRIGDLVR